MIARRRAEDWEVARLGALLAAMLAGFLLLTGALWRLQVREARRLEVSLARQSIRRVRLPGIRGTVVDREGRKLAENRPAYAVCIYLEELRLPGPWSRTIAEVEATIDRLAEILERPREVDAADIERHIRARLPLPFRAWRDLGEAEVARWAERGAGLPGVDIVPEAVRHYPQGATAAHVLGYVGRADFVQSEEHPYHYYLPEMEGRRGIERHHDARLRGEAGGRLVRVDVSGYRHEDLGFRPPRAGSDLMLTLDLDIQRRAEAALEGLAGAAVVVDPRNGEVLAMASAPAFDPNAFAPAIGPAAWAALRDDPGHPLFNRAAAGAYAPGSVFKPVTALAALVNDRLDTGARLRCDGVLVVGRPFHCWERSGHGALDLRQAIERSCNVYFYRVALGSGADPIAHMARTLGLGRRTGIDLDADAAGLVPDDAWKRRTVGDAWRDGDTCNLSIGQGALAVSPLQMAMLTAALANGGQLFRPRLLRAVRAPDAAGFERTRPELVNDPGWDPALLAPIRAGMRDAVMSARGTGRLARVEGVTVSGKTGTAQYGAPGERRNRGWMIAYAPSEAPRVAIAMVADDAVSGGATVGPRMRQLLEGIFFPAAERAGETP